MHTPTSYTAFADDHRIAAGTLPDVAHAVRRILDTTPDATILIFDDGDGRQAEVDWRGSADEVRARVAADEDLPHVTPRGRGRPKLGVVAREVTLLPRHWAWLGSQPGGASARLRRLVEDAMRGKGAGERARQSGEAAYRFMTTMAGNRPGFEEALRAFYRSDHERFNQCMADWPRDIREHAQRLAAAAWDDQVDTESPT